MATKKEAAAPKKKPAALTKKEVIKPKKLTPPLGVVTKTRFEVVKETLRRRGRK